jgi:hypothetical protein
MISNKRKRKTIEELLIYRKRINENDVEKKRRKE